MAAFPNDTFYAPGKSYYLKNPVDDLLVGGSITMDGSPPIVLTNGGGFLAVGGKDVAAGWSAFPTLSNTIAFDGANNLSNVSGNLYFNDELLAVAGAISNVADWSLYPAIGDVDLQTNSLLMKAGIALSNTGNIISFGSDVLNTKLWSTLPATQSVDVAGNTITNTSTISGQTGTSNLTLTSSSNLVFQASNAITGVADIIQFTATDTNPLNTPAMTLRSSNGFQGQINLDAYPGLAGIGGEINLTARGGSLLGVGYGGLIEMTATTPVGISNVTSAIRQSAAGINSYAGVTSSFGSTFGYNYIHGDVGVNITAGLLSVVPNFPGTLYLYGTAGTTCANGLYVDHIYPYSDTLTFPNLLITGNTLTGADVEISNVVKLDGDNCVITGISNATITNLLGVSTINGSPVPNLANWSSFPALTDVNMSGYSITNLLNVNGSPYDFVSNWANYQALSNVDANNYDVKDVRKLTFSNSINAANVGFWSTPGFGGIEYPVPTSIMNGGSNGSFRTYGCVLTIDRSGVPASYVEDIQFINQGVISNLPRAVLQSAADIVASDIVPGLQDCGVKVIVGATGASIALTKYNRTDTWIFTSGTTQNFTAATLDADDAGKVWYVRTGNSNDVDVTYNGSFRGTLHKAVAGRNQSTCYLVWTGTDLLFY